MTDMPWKEAIEHVLRQSGEAMHYTEIAEQIVERGLRNSVGATPGQTVTAMVTNSIQSDGERSPFYRPSRGMIGLIASRENGSTEAVAVSEVVVEAQINSVIRALGMYWLRSNVSSTSTPAILGRQQIGADTVDFSEQRGVYLLHDRHSVVYVGRSTDRPLGRRLYEHTQDRLNGRWDRFSWFGVCGVSNDGQLGRHTNSADGEAIICAFESILIECLEPSQNRRRGDNLNAVEFMQARDPEIDKSEKLELLQQVLKSVVE